MNYYFFSEIDCYLKFNGEYLGLVNKNVKTVNLNDNGLFEFIPISEAYFPKYYLTTENKKGVYRINDNTLYIPYFTKIRQLPYKIIMQKNFDKFNLTVTTDGCIKFYLDGNFYATDELPFLPNDVEFYTVNDTLLLFFKNTRVCIYAYNLKTGELVFKNIVNSFDINNNLSVTETFYYPVNYTVTKQWIIDTTFTLNSVVVSEIQSEIPPTLIPFYFCSFIKQGVLVADFLCDNLKPRANDFTSFLGEIDYILPSFSTIENEVCIISNNTVNLVRFEFENNLIKNVYIY